MKEEERVVEVQRKRIFPLMLGLMIPPAAVWIQLRAFEVGLGWYFLPLIALYFLSGLYILHEGIFGRVGLRIDRHGLWHWAVGTIYWKDVESVCVLDGSNRAGLGFRLRRSHESMQDAGRWVRLMARIRGRGDAATVSCWERQISPEDFRKEVGRHVEVGSPHS